MTCWPDPTCPTRSGKGLRATATLCPAMIEAASSYPDALVQRLVAGPGEPEVVVSLIAGPDRAGTEHTLNSFLNCCTDVSRVGRFLVLDAGLSPRTARCCVERYGFLEFCPLRPRRRARRPTRPHPRSDPRTVLAAPGPGLAIFCPRKLHHPPNGGAAGRTQVFQVGINFTDAVKLTGASAAEQTVRRAPDAGRYVSPRRWHAARRCSTPHAWIEPAVYRAPTQIRSPNSGGGRPPPGCAPPASTRCSASPQPSKCSSPTARHGSGRRDVSRNDRRRGA